mmetsp:Transcript_17992/g.25130  ORF Transcript_17992/g.25130 Transcript_17992/m.25130 type:complete len:161 (-) Transcript_17992:38-520(-)
MKLLPKRRWRPLKENNSEENNTRHHDPENHSVTAHEVGKDLETDQTGDLKDQDEKEGLEMAENLVTEEKVENTMIEEMVKEEKVESTVTEDMVKEQKVESTVKEETVREDPSGKRTTTSHKSEHNQQTRNSFANKHETYLWNAILAFSNTALPPDTSTQR